MTSSWGAVGLGVLLALSVHAAAEPFDPRALSVAGVKLGASRDRVEKLLGRPLRAYSSQFRQGSAAPVNQTWYDYRCGVSAKCSIRYQSGQVAHVSSDCALFRKGITVRKGQSVAEFPCPPPRLSTDGRSIFEGREVSQESEDWYFRVEKGFAKFSFREARLFQVDFSTFPYECASFRARRDLEERRY